MKQQKLCFVDFGFSHITLAVCAINNDKFENILFLKTITAEIPLEKLHHTSFYDKNFDVLVSLVNEAEKTLRTNICEIVFLIKDKMIKHYLEKQVLKFTNIQKINQLNMEKIAKLSISDFYNKCRNNYEITDFIKHNFKLDDDKILQNPYKMKTKSFELRASIFAVRKTSSQLFCDFLEKYKIHTKHYLCSSEALYHLYNEQKNKHTTMIIDIGACNTECLIIHDNCIVFSSILEMGGIDITRDIASVMKIYLKDAEKIKTALSIKNSNNLYDEVKKIPMMKNISISQFRSILRQAEEIADARFEEITRCLSEKINAIFKKICIGKILICGGSANYKNSIKIIQDGFNCQNVGFCNENDIEKHYVFINKITNDKVRQRVFTKNNISLLGAIAFYIDSLERYKLAKRGFIFNITKKFSCLLKDILY